MQPCNRIYYSKIYRRLNVFRAAYRSSSGASNCICSFWFIYPCGDRSLSRLGGKYSLELLMMSGMPLETCWPFNKFWNNKFYYKVASCRLFLLIHTTMHGSMNIKFKGPMMFITVHYKEKILLQIMDMFITPQLIVLGCINKKIYISFVSINCVINCVSF
jgi:hypothetical protein